MNLRNIQLEKKCIRGKFQRINIKEGSKSNINCLIFNETRHQIINILTKQFKLHYLIT